LTFPALDERYVLWEGTEFFVDPRPENEGDENEELPAAPTVTRRQSSASSSSRGRDKRERGGNMLTARPTSRESSYPNQVTSRKAPVTPSTLRQLSPFTPQESFSLSK
jgi:hypothetical protein